MKKRLFIIAMALLFVINITALTTFSYHRWIKPRPDPAEAGQQVPWQDLRERISLSAEQSRNMIKKRLSFQQEVGSLRQQMWELRSDLVEEARNPSPDMDRIDSLIEKIGALQVDIQKKSIRDLLEDKKFLTPRQQEKYFSLFREHAQGRNRWFRNRGMGRRGQRWLK